MKSAILLLTIVSLGFARLACSEEVVEVKDMGQMLAQIKLEKKQMESMVDKLVVSGRLSPEHAVKVRREIASVKDEDAELVKKHVISVINSQQKN